MQFNYTFNLSQIILLLVVIISPAKIVFGQDVTCTAPYFVLSEAGTCVWSCGNGTEPGITECICSPGLIENGHDSFGRRICSNCTDIPNHYTDENGNCSYCPPPYHGVTPDSRCVWSCAAGTEPNNTNNECTCQQGYFDLGAIDFSGRRICNNCTEIPNHYVDENGNCSFCPPPYHGVTPDSRCVWSCATGTEPNNTNNECDCRIGFVLDGLDFIGRRICKCPAPYHGETPEGNCVWGCAAGTTPNFTSYECECRVGFVPDGFDSIGRRKCKCPAPYHVESAEGNCDWSCGSNTIPSLTTNECECKEGFVQIGIDNLQRRICSCPAPYHVEDANRNCTWICAPGTTPNFTSNECDCLPGYIQSGIDKTGRRICSCRAPYHEIDANGNCVWSCAAGTTPNYSSYECDCLPGYSDSGKDVLGRKTCRCRVPYHVMSATGECVWSCGAGTAPNTTSNICDCIPGFVPNGTDASGRKVCVCPSPYHVITTTGTCGWNCATGSGTIPNTTTNQCECRPGYWETSQDSIGRRICTCPAPYHMFDSDRNCVWSCASGTTPNYATGECVCMRGYVQSGKDTSGRRICTLFGGGIIKLDSNEIPSGATLLTTMPLLSILLFVFFSL